MINGNKIDNIELIEDDFEFVPVWDDVAEEINKLKKFLWFLDNEEAYKIIHEVNERYIK